jgi:hypothetical protein
MIRKSAGCQLADFLYQVYYKLQYYPGVESF